MQRTIYLPGTLYINKSCTLSIYANDIFMQTYMQNINKMLKKLHMYKKSYGQGQDVDKLVLMRYTGCSSDCVLYYFIAMLTILHNSKENINSVKHGLIEYIIQDYIHNLGIIFSTTFIDNYKIKYWAAYMYTEFIHSR